MSDQDEIHEGTLKSIELAMNVIRGLPGSERAFIEHTKKMNNLIRSQRPGGFDPHFEALLQEIEEGTASIEKHIGQQEE